MVKSIDLEVFRFISTEAGISIEGFITDPDPFKHKSCQNIKTSAIVGYCPINCLVFTFSGSVYKLFPTKQGLHHNKESIVNYLKSNKQIIKQTKEKARSYYETKKSV